MYQVASVLEKNPAQEVEQEAQLTQKDTGSRQVAQP